MLHSATPTASMTQVFQCNNSRSVLKFDLTHLRAEIWPWTTSLFFAPPVMHSRNTNASSGSISNMVVLEAFHTQNHEEISSR